MRKSADGGRWRNRGILFAACLAVMLVLELFVFNLPFWQSRGDSTVSIAADSMQLGSGLERSAEGLKVVDKDNAFVEVRSDQPIRYLRVQMADHADVRTIGYRLAVSYDTADGGGAKAADGRTGNVTDDNAGVGFHEGSDRLVSNVSDDAGLINAGGRYRMIRIKFIANDDDVLPISAVQVNARVPFGLDLIRIALMLAIIAFIVFLGPRSPLYARRFSTASWVQVASVALVTLCSVLFVLYAWRISGGTKYWSGTFGAPDFHIADLDQYGVLANSIIAGHPWLDLPVDPGLARMDNPYDVATRTQLAQDGAKIYFDHAFYDGHYYMYFGVIPALVAFVPFKLLTGTMLSSGYATAAFCVLATVAATFVVLGLRRMYFAKASWGAVLLAIIMATAGSNILYQAFTPSFYSVPQAASMMFTAAALACWLWSRRTRGDAVVVSSPLIFLGSLFMACNLGCRPQFILMALFAVPIFWDCVFTHRALFSLRGLLPTICACLPFVLVFVPLGLYNHARFGSYFDFGANYNLTGFDMTHATKPFTSILSILFYFFLQPGSIIGNFPFVTSTPTPAPIWSPMEPSIGGIAMIAPFTLIILLLPWLPRFRRQVLVPREGQDSPSHKKKSRGLALLKSLLDRGGESTVVLLVVCVVLAVVIAAVDGKVAGFAWRYITDFGWPIVIASIVGFLSLESALAEDGADGDAPARTRTSGTVLYLVMSAAVLFSVIYQFFSFFTLGRYGDMSVIAPNHYFDVAGWFLFLA